MSVGSFFLIAAAVVFFLLAVGMALFPGAHSCGLFLLCMGLLLSGYQIPQKGAG